MDEAIKYKAKSNFALILDLAFFIFNYLSLILYSMAWLHFGFADLLAKSIKQTIIKNVTLQTLVLILCFVIFYSIIFILIGLVKRIILRFTGLRKTVFSSLRLILIDICLAIPILNKFVKMTNLEFYNKAFFNGLIAWSKGQKIELSDIVIIHVKHFTEETNASTISLGKQQKVYLLDTLFDRFSISEIEAIVAHEFGHKQRDDSKTNLYLMGARFVGLFLFAGWGIWYLPPQRSIDVIPTVIILLTFYWFCTNPLVNAISRDQEIFADSFATLHISDSDNLINALQKMRLESFDFITPPKWIEFLILSYPCITKRIESIVSLSRVISHTVIDEK